MHSLLKRQIKKSGIPDPDTSPALASWLQVVARVSQSYTEADQERYLLERSLNISSREMQDLSGRLAAERDRLTAILNSLGDGLCTLDSAGRLLFMNPAAEQLLGWPEHELVGRDLLAVVAAPATAPTADASREPPCLGALIDSGQPYRDDDGSFARKDGSVLPVSFALAPLTSQGQLSGAVLLFRDITERKQAESAQNQLIRRDSLLRLARRMAAETDPERVLTDLLDEAVVVLGGDDGTLTRWEPAKGGLLPVRNTVPTAAEYTFIAIGEGVSGRAVEQREPVILNDYQSQSGHETPAGVAGVRAAVAVPLLHEGRLLGALSVNTYDPARRFTDEDARVLELLAGIGSGLLANLARATELAEANQELKQARDAAQFQALHDSLTGLPNRSLLRDRLHQAILNAERDKSSLALLMMDLDRFKDVNDTLGHQTGDELLQQVAARLRTMVRASDTVSRMGGDEFCIILPAAHNADDARHVAHTLAQALEQPFMVGDQCVTIGASIGVAMFPEHGTDPTSLLRHADVAMYAAKRDGGGSAVYSLERDVNDPDRLVFISELRHAIDGGELVLNYQPKISLRSGECEHVEALVRWRHPQRGIVAPDEFIAVAEQTGLIKPLTRWVLNEALRQLAVWSTTGQAIPVAVNLSMHNLHDPDLVEQVAHGLSSWAVAPALLKVEVTESAVMSDPHQALETLSNLRAMGVEVAIDDFGTGHSSLSYLKQLPVQEIKLDRSFVRDMQNDAHDYAIVRSTIELAHTLGLSVVAEGVEDEATWDLLAGLGCDTAQGYYMSRPLSAEDLTSWLAASPWGRRSPTAGAVVSPLLAA